MFKHGQHPGTLLIEILGCLGHLLHRVWLPTGHEMVNQLVALVHHALHVRTLRLVELAVPGRRERE